MRYRLRTLLIMLTLLPPLLASGFWSWEAWRKTQRTKCSGGLKQISIALHSYDRVPVQFPPPVRPPDLPAE